MNPRIKQLAEQAEGTKKHVPAVWQFYDHELEKFAELIVAKSFDAVINDGRFHDSKGVVRAAKSVAMEYFEMR